MKLTGLLFTCNRPRTLIRMLARIEKLPFEIWILDGSKAPNIEAQKKLTPSGRRCYHHMPDLWPSQRVRKIADRLKTAYVLPMSDDDVFIGEGIQRAVAFLETRSDLAAAQGSFWIKHVRRGGDLFDLEARGPSLLENDCQERIGRHCRYFSHTYYAVHRRDVFLASMRNADQFKDRGFLYEWVQSLTTVALGKVQRFARPYCIRTANYEADLQARYTQHPVTWRQFDRQGYAQVVADFLRQSAELPIFRELVATGRLDLRAHLNEYLSTFDRPERNVLEHHRHLIHTVEAIFPGARPLEAIARLDGQWREKEIGALETIERGLETLLQYLHYFVEADPGDFATPYWLLEKDKLRDIGANSGKTNSSNPQF